MLPATKERALIRQAKNGDGDAIAELIRAHQDALYAFILRMSGRPHIAEDIVQEAFVRVLKNLDRFDSRFRFSTWLFTIAKRLYMNAVQKHKPVYDSEMVGGRAGSAEEPWSEPAQWEARHKDADAIGRALQELNPQQREIVILFHQQEWPIALIAEFVGMPEGTIKSHLHRGRKKMREYFEKHESRELAARYGAEASWA
jgi:RNA polymerase sigma-70 factor (ECF subfamily)